MFVRCLFRKDRLYSTCILFVSAIANRLFTKQLAIKPQFTLGHSLGEFSALVNVGALELMDALELVHKRGLFMQEACEGVQVAQAIPSMG